MSNAIAIPSGVGDWHFRRDVKYKKVRELMELGEANAAYVNKHQAKPPKDYHEQIYAMQWERIQWMFDNLVCDKDGNAFPDMKGAEAFEELGWIELRDLEAAATDFLFQTRQDPVD